MDDKLSILICALCVLVPLCAVAACCSSVMRRALLVVTLAAPACASLLHVEWSLVWDETYRGSTRGISLALNDATALALGIVLLRVRRRMNWWPAGSWILLALFLWSASTAFVADRPDYVAFEAFKLLRAYLFFWVLANYFEEFGDLRLLVGTFVGVVLAEAIEGCHQHLTGQYRATGMLTDPNLLGMYVNVLLAVLWAVALESRGLWQAACLGSFGAGAVLVLITYSRGSWLILAGTTALIACVLAALRWQRRKLLILLPAACVPLFVFMLKADSLLGRWGTGLRELGGDSYATARGLGPALAMIGDYPFAGVGLNHICFMLENRRYGDDVDPYERQVIHNVYVTTAAETGVVGAGLLVVAVVWFLAIGVRTAWRVRHSPFALALAVGATAGILSVAVHSFSEWVARIIVILQVQGTMAAVIVSLERRSVRTPDLTTERHRLTLLHSPQCAHSRRCSPSHSSPSIA